MKKLITILLITLLCSAFQSCKKVRGEGPVVTEMRGITGFTGVNAGIDGDVYFTQDSVYKVEIHAQQNILDVMETSISNGELKIYFQRNKLVGRHDRVSIYVSAPNINSLGVNGSGNLYVQQPIRTDNMDLKITGSGAMRIADMKVDGNLTARISGSGDVAISTGTADHQAIEISGSGSMDFLNVAAHNADVHISGSGSAKVNISDVLNVSISGSGDVYYMGSPKVNSSISGSGKVRKI